MMKMMKRGLSLVLALVMIMGLLPVTAFAAVDSSGRPKDVDNKLILSIYTGSGFPGEPAVYGTSNYKNINSSFAVRSGATFASSAAGQLDWEKINKDIVQGASSGSTSVWGVYDANGTKDYFLSGASIIDPDNEIKMIRAVKNCTAAEAENYEIVWYVIKLQHSTGWFGATEWHIDGVIKEKEKISINYYGNGNTSGNAPLGTTTHTAGDSYTVLDENTMVKKINGVEVAFLGWSAKADGTGAEAGFYQPGDVIHPKESISLYAMWDTTTQYTATVKTYLDGTLTSANDIHEDARELYLSTDKEHYYKLTEDSEGIYTTKITGNGKFHLYLKNAEGEYTQLGAHQLTIYNQNGSLDVHHYSVTYDPNEGAFATDPGKQVFAYGDAVTAIETTPARAGYRFLGWQDAAGNLIQPGKEVTASITAPIKLTAQWEKTVNVTINVTVNHVGTSGGWNQAPGMEQVVLTVASKENADAPYIEVGQTLELNETKHDGFAYGEEKNDEGYVLTTLYKGYTLTDMPGGSTEYTVVTSKSGYETNVTHRQDENGDWIIDVVMTYKPSNFDVAFNVTVDGDVPDAYVPKAAIVKVTFWATGDQCWKVISQQADGEPGVRAEFDSENRTASGSYPVWKYEDGDGDPVPYGYRVVVTSFVYPDGTIVPVKGISNTMDPLEWSDGVYTAQIQDVIGGNTYGELDGAYYNDKSQGQSGNLDVVITMDLYNLTFDAQGGKVNGMDSQTLKEQYKIPSFKDYVPTRAGGYTFGGWYLEPECKNLAVEGTDLEKDITLYAKWIEPLTISGTVTILGTYELNNQTVPVNDIDKAAEAVVVLLENRDGSYYEVDSYPVEFTYGEDENGTGSYSFTGIPNEGKEYRIELLLLNYGTKYDNEIDADKSFDPDEYNAVFGGDNEAEVDAHLTFVPPSYDQEMEVDATEISAAYRPASVLAKVLYRDTGDNHNFQVISQHRDDASLGVNITLINGEGSGSESIWKWHTNGTLYEYQMDIVKVQGNKLRSDVFNSDEAPFYILYTEPVYWDNDANDLSGPMVATLIPKIYPVTFDLNAGTDDVTGMDSYKVEEEDPDEEGKVNVTYEYAQGHKWSYATEFSAVPQREGYTFLGWETTVNGVTSDDKGNVEISADVQQEVVLKAMWEQITYEVTAAAEPVEGGTVSGADTYAHGSEATVTATVNDGYTFLGWYEGEDKVCDELEYTFTVESARALTAKYSLNAYDLETEAIPAAGGITTGGGTYDYGTSVELTATANPGYSFVGWQTNSEEVSKEASIHVTVTEDVTYDAIFSLNRHTVTTKADPAEGGEVTRGDTFYYGTQITVKATAETGYKFTGWYENNELVCETAEYSFEVTSDRVLTAQYEKQSFEVTAIAEQGGTAEGTATYFYGDTATVKATVSDSYTFDGWYEGEQKISGKLEYTFTVTSNRTLTAKFTINGYQVIAKPNYEERGTTSGSGYYVENEEATITASAKAGYIFVGWFDKNNEKVSDDISYKFIVTSDCTLTARFSEAFTINTEASPVGAGTLVGGGTYESGADITITAAANPGYYFVGWYDELNNYIAEPEFNLHVIENKTFTAKFEKKVSYHCDYVYIFGYEDTVIGAEGTLLRCELAQMIYRLVKQNEGPQLDYKVFDDTDGEWFKTGISYMALKGAIDVNASTANPYVAVSRGETYKMICLGLNFTTDTTLDYSDYAAILRNSGYLTADSAVTGRIARWEFCQLFNAIIGRTNAPLVDQYGNAITAETYNYTDLSEDDFYYEIMLRACSTYYNGVVDVDRRAQRNDLDEYYG